MTNENDPNEASPYTPDRAWANAYPPGATFVGFTDLDKHPDWEFLLAGLDRDISWASPRPFRHGGYAPADRAVQQQIYLLVGAITVAGAHAETDMKRILLANAPDTTQALPRRTGEMVRSDESPARPRG